MRQVKDGGMDEAEELIRLSARALVAQMSGAPGFELHMTQTCVLGLTAEPSADFNMLTIGPDPNAADFFVRSVSRARERGLPLLALLSPHVAEDLAPVAMELGLAQVGASPLMVLRPGTAIPPCPPIRTTRVLGEDLVSAAGDLVSAAFDVPRDAVARCIDVGITDTAGVETYIAWREDKPLSAVTVTPAGNTAGISLMATSPDHQRKGLGRALLTQVMGDFRRRGVERFYLGATEAGRQLYDSLGFEPVADLTAWILSDPSAEA